uniref:Serpentine Receptor, class H n=1 Tax=Caenorhabditis tropicalis TaxID=1561998 RepID=A0A1I7U2H5_9PELO
MNSVKISLLVSHFWACFVDLVFTILVSPFALAPLYAGYPMGVLQWMEVGVAHQAIFTMASTEAMLVGIMGVYENRFLVLSHYGQWWRPIRIPFFALNYLLALVAYFPVYYLVPDQGNAKEWVLERLPCLTPEILSRPLFIVAEDVTLTLHSSGVASSTITFEAFVFFVLVTISLNQYGTQLSKKTIEMQKKFMKSVIFQLVAPIFYIGYSAKFKYYNQKLTNFSIILIASHGLVSSITMLIAQAPYRQVIIGYFWFLGRIIGIRRRETEEDQNVFQSRNV